MRGFPKETVSYLMPFLDIVWSQLIKSTELYSANYVLSEHEQEEDVDSDGEVVGLESILFSMFDYIGIAAKKKGFRTLMNSSNSQFLNQLADLLIKYMQMTVEMESCWSTDMNQFIQDDEEDALNFNVRIAAEELLRVCFGLCCCN